MQKENEEALECNTDLQNIDKLGELNKLAYENLVLSINTNSSIGKVTFGLVWDTKSLEFLEE